MPRRRTECERSAERDRLAEGERLAERDWLIERERLGSTGFGKGVALPHAKLQGLLKEHPTATLLFMAHDEKHCNAVVLAEYLHEHAPRKRAKA